MKTISKKSSFCCHFTKHWRKFTFLNNRNAFLLITSKVFIFSEYVITTLFSHRHVLSSELLQSKTTVKTPCFRAKKNSAEQRWVRENQIWSALILSVFSESALKNVKTQKQHCPERNIFGTSTRVHSSSRKKLTKL